MHGYVYWYCVIFDQKYDQNVAFTQLKLIYATTPTCRKAVRKLGENVYAHIFRTKAQVFIEQIFCLVVNMKQH